MRAITTVYPERCENCVSRHIYVGSCGIAIGSLLSSKAPEKLLRVLLAATLTLVGVRLVLS